jgi:glycine cleavage system aminomethyltransferase T
LVINNAVNAEKIGKLLQEREKKFEVKLDINNPDALEYCLLAIQGKLAENCLLELFEDEKSKILVRSLRFGWGCRLEIGGATCLTIRRGYTGEDGFEVR